MNHQDRMAHLRRTAERRLIRNREVRAPSTGPDDPQRLLHELQVHQIELEMQNDELRQAHAELEQHRHQLQALVDARSGALRDAHQRLVDAEHARAREREAAESARAARHSFLANVSHEIRTPLSTIAGMAYLLRRADVTPHQSQRLDVLESACKHVLEIVDALQDFANLDAGRMVIDAVDVDLGKLLDSAASDVSGLANDRGVRLAIDSAAPHCRLVGDSARLGQALLNCATHAIRLTDAGSVTLRARVDSQHEDGAIVRFEVEYRGSAIADRSRSTLFEDGGQVESPSACAHGVAAPGLAITKRLARLMGGDADAQFTPGVGTTFWFTARLARGAPLQPGEPATPAG